MKFFLGYSLRVSFFSRNFYLHEFSLYFAHPSHDFSNGRSLTIACFSRFMVDFILSSKIEIEIAPIYPKKNL